MDSECLIKSESKGHVKNDDIIQFIRRLMMWLTFEVIIIGICAIGLTYLEVPVYDYISRKEVKIAKSVFFFIISMVLTLSNSIINFACTDWSKSISGKTLSFIITIVTTIFNIAYLLELSDEVYIGLGISIVVITCIGVIEGLCAENFQKMLEKLKSDKNLKEEEKLKKLKNLEIGILGVVAFCVIVLVWFVASGNSEDLPFYILHLGNALVSGFFIISKINQFRKIESVKELDIIYGLNNILADYIGTTISIFELFGASF